MSYSERDIEKLAASGSEMPDDFHTGEQLLFLTLRQLYHNYRAGIISREQAAREKQEILRSYRIVEMQYQALEEHVKLRRRIELETNDGDDQLRELVRQLSERSTENETRLERVRWVLGEEGTAEQRISKIAKIV